MAFKNKSIKQIISRFLLFIIFLGIFIACSDDHLNSDTSSEAFAEKPPEGTELFFNVFSDSANGEIYYTKLITKALTAGVADMNIHIGDMISNPEHYIEWPYFKSISSRLEYKSELHVTIGNHDVNDTESLSQIRRFFPKIPEKGYYSFTKGIGYFIILNSQEIGAGNAVSATQLTWLDNQLSSTEAQNSKYIAVFIHKPIFPQNNHIHTQLTNYDDLHQLFVNNDVKIVFSGHEHNYTHTIKDHIHYIITGGSGSKLSNPENGDDEYYHFTQVSVLSDRLHIRIIDIYGRTRDSFELLF